MKILLTGCTGFIGRHLLWALRERGHELVAAGRTRPRDASLAWLALDFSRPAPAAEWAARLRGFDVVVNTIGLFRETARQRFQAVHIDGPVALFDACAAAGVKRVLQVSALGVDAATTGYQRSKLAADTHLLALPLEGIVVRPSLVFGLDGPSAALFLTLASLPLLALPAGARPPLQPLHVDDAAQALRALVERGTQASAGRRCIALVGPRALSLAEYLQALRKALQLPPAPTLAVPVWLVELGARMAGHVPRSLFDRASWKMLQQGSSADAAPTVQLLGHVPREAHEFVPAEHAQAQRQQARLRWLVPLLRLSIALVWIATGLVSLGLYPVEQSYALLGRSGVPPALQPLMLYGAAWLDLLLGVLTLWPLRRHWRPRLWRAQIALIAGYTLIISLRLPEFWLHPYGPLTKNLPMLALLALLLALEPPQESRWRT
jgi:uncharacterized protein YbjT (DUF2867 family)/uncharacterized membrane protein YphA (DoxX/SURF4 family)